MLFHSRLVTDLFSLLVVCRLNTSNIICARDQSAYPNTTLCCLAWPFYCCFPQPLSCADQLYLWPHHILDCCRIQWVRRMWVSYKLTTAWCIACRQTPSPILLQKRKCPEWGWETLSLYVCPLSELGEGSGLVYTRPGWRLDIFTKISNLGRSTVHVCSEDWNR